MSWFSDEPFSNELRCSVLSLLFSAEAQALAESGGPCVIPGLGVEGFTELGLPKDPRPRIGVDAAIAIAAGPSKAPVDCPV